MPAFVPGLDVARAFYTEVVAPIVGARPHAAARLGSGSDVLGFDTERSTDHDWGPRVQLVLADDHEPGDADAVRRALDAQLPESFRGLRVRFSHDLEPPEHHVTVETTSALTERIVGFDPRAGLDTVDWLTTPEQRLLELTRGAVFRDDVGELTHARSLLARQPDDVWLWMLACQWRRIEQEEPFVGRTAELGDDLGSRVLAARLARDLMLLCFRLERVYAPYPKWLGTAFAQLDAARDVGPALARAVRADAIVEREAALVDACEAVARRHNALSVTEPLEPTARRFHSRPFRVIGAGRFVAACLASMTDPVLLALPLIGSIDQWSDNTDLRAYPPRFRRAREMYGRAPSA
jgi:hypothetical protein